VNSGHSGFPKFSEILVQFFVQFKNIFWPFLKLTFTVEVLALATNIKLGCKWQEVANIK
jgi:hypothetical protein